MIRRKYGFLPTSEKGLSAENFVGIIVIVAFVMLLASQSAPGDTLRRPKQPSNARLGANMIYHTKPACEEFIVERIVGSAWRLRRAIAVEKKVMEKSRTDMDIDFGIGNNDIFRDKLHMVMNSSLLERLLRYEKGIERSLYKAMEEYKKL